MEYNAIDCILRKFPERLREPLNRCLPVLADRVTEIVLRSGRPLCVYSGRRCSYITKTGGITDAPDADLLCVSHMELERILLRMCNDSLYAFQNEINSGFVTIDGGVRAGICGRAVIRNGEIINICDVTTLSFRIAREVKGCSKELMSLVYPQKGLLLCGAPGSGKTTVIRDIARLISYRFRVSVLDERGELSASDSSGNGFDLGMADVYLGYPKGKAAHAAVRSMSPDVIICDEIGDRDDATMLRQALRCGVSFIASAHASSMEELRVRPTTCSLLKTGAFRYIAFLSGKEEAGKLKRIYEFDDVCA